MINCHEAIKNATGKDDYSLEEVDQFIQQAEKIKQRILSDETIADKDAALTAALNEAKDEIIQPALIEKRNKLINERRMIDLERFIESSYSDDFGKGIHALIAGSEEIRSGSRMSIDAEQKSVSGQYFGGMLADLDAQNLVKAAGSGEFDRDIARYMWGEKVDNEIAVKIGDIYKKYQEKARLDQNKAGAFIRKNENYVTRQSHDVDKIAKAKKEDWVNFIKDKLDSRTFDDVDDPQKYLESVYDALSTGVHLNNSSKKVDDLIKQFKGPSNLAKKISQGRSLHFKSADDWMDYNDKFGTGRLAESVSMSMQSAADQVGLMRVLGTNPENMIDALYERLMLKTDDRKALNDSRRYTNNLMAVVTGETRIAGNQMFASVMSNIRNLQSMAKLGGALLSSIGSDNVAYAMEVKYQGGSIFSGIAESMSGLTKGRRDPETRKIAASLGVTMDSFAGNLAGRFNVNEGFNGLSQRMMNQFFRWNGLSWWTDSLKISAAIGSSNRLALSADSSYSSLAPELKRVLKLYGIEDAEWNVIRKGKQTHQDIELLTPEAQEDLPDELFKSLIESRGFKPTKRAIEDARLELQRKLRNYVSDRQSYAILESDARSQATWTQGTKRGTPMGELIRSMGQFKQFPTVFFQRIIGREVKGRNIRRSGELGMDKVSDSPLFGVARLMAAMTMAGYVSMSAKDIAKGRTPRQFNDDPMHNFKIMSAAIIQGGGLGIYGDFLFGDMTRHGAGPLQTLVGPSIGVAEDIIKLWQKAKAGDDPSANAVTLLINNTPFMNLFYTRIALDYMFLYELRENLNSGYLKRMERRLKKENDQEYLFPPSQYGR